MSEIDAAQQHRKLLVTQYYPGLCVARHRPVKSSLLEFFRAHPQAGRIPEKNLQPIALRIRKQKKVAAQGIAQQLIAHQTIQAVEPFALLRCTAKAQLCVVYRYADFCRYRFLIFRLYLLRKQQGFGSTLHNVAFLGSPSVAQGGIYMDISELVARSHRMKAGCVAQHLNGFATELTELGYTTLSINDFLISAIHFGAWLEISGRSLDDVSELTVSVFGAHRCKCPGGRSLKRISQRFTGRVQRFVDHLQQQGAISPFTNSKTEAPTSLSAFRNWLSSHRGLAIKTVDRHERLVMQMLPALGANAGTYNAASVRKVILERIWRHWFHLLCDAVTSGPRISYSPCSGRKSEYRYAPSKI